MRSKSWILLVIALGCGAIASVGISQVVLDQRGQAPGEESVVILVAIKDMDVGTKVTSENVKLDKWPRDRLPTGHITDLKEVDGKYSGQRFYQGEPILQKKLMNSVDSIATTIPKGWLIFDLSVDEKTGGAGYVKPGHRVNVYGFFEKSGKIAETKSVLVMENVNVFAVDGNAARDPEEKTGKASRTIQLLIKSSQYDALFAASNLSKQMRVSLRPPGEESSNLETDNGERFLKWLHASEGANDALGLNPAPISLSASVPDAKPTQTLTPSIPERQMVVITSNGVTKWRFSDSTSIPELIDESKPTVASVQKPTTPGGIPSGMSWNSSTSQWSPGGFTSAYPDAEDKAEAPSPKEPSKASEKGQR